MALFERLVPADAEGYLRRAKSLLRRRRHDEARAEAEAGLQVDPGNVGLMRVLLNVGLATDDEDRICIAGRLIADAQPEALDELVSDLERYRRSSGTSPAIRDLLIELLIASASFEAAEELMRAAAKEDPDYIRRATERFSRRLGDDPGDLRSRYALCFAYSIGGDPFEAVSQLQAILQVAPHRLDNVVHCFERLREVYSEFGLIHYCLGLAYGRSERFADAEQAFRRALEIDANLQPQILKSLGGMARLTLPTPEIICLLAECHARAGSPDEAVKELESALGRDESQASSIAEACARIAAMVEDNERVSQLWARALVASRQFDDAVKLYVKLREREGTGLNVALQGFGQILAVDPSFTPAASGLVETLIAAGRYEEAAERLLRMAGQDALPDEELEDLFRSLLEGAPNLARPHLGLGFHYLARGQQSEAIDALRTATRLDGQLTPEVVERLQEAIDERPESYDLRYGLGDVLDVAGRVQEAVECYREIYRLDESQRPTLIDKVRALPERNGGSVPASVLLSELLADDGQADAARRTLADLIEDDRLEPQSLIELCESRFDLAELGPHVRFTLGKAYLVVGSHASAVEQITRAFTADASLVEEALATYDEALDRIGETEGFPRAMVLMGLARARLASGDLIGVVRALDVAVAADADMVPRALQGLERVLAESPDLPEALETKARLHWLSGDVDGALMSYDQFLAAAPTIDDAALARLEQLAGSETSNLAARYLSVRACTKAGQLARASGQLEEILALSEGEAENVASLYGQILEADPEVAEARFGAGIACVRMGRPDDAVSHFDQALGEADADLGRLTAGYQEVLSQDEQHLGALWSLSTVCRRQRDLEAECQQYRRIISVDSAALPRVTERCEELAQEHASDAAVQELLAETQLRSGDYEGALASLALVLDLDADPSTVLAGCEEIIREDPDNIRARRVRGRALLRAGRTDDALKELEHVSQTSDDLAEELTEAYQAVLEQDGSNNSARLGLARAYCRGGQLDDACQAYRQLLSQDPMASQDVVAGALEILGHEEERVEARLLLAEAYQASEQFGEAVEQFGHVLRLDPGQFQEVGERLREILEMDEDSARAHLVLGGVYARQNSCVEALAHFGRSVQLDRGLVHEVADGLEALCAKEPDHGQLYLALGRLYVDYGVDDEKAIECYRLGLRVVSDEEYQRQLHAGLGRAYRAAGRIEEAAYELSQAFSMGPISREDVALLCAAVKEQREKEAAEHAAKFEENPADVAAALGLTRRLIAAGRYHEATAALKRCNYSPDEKAAFHVQLLLGLAQLEAHRPQDAAESFMRAMAHTESESRACDECRFLLALAEERQGLYEQAVRRLQQIQDRHGDFLGSSRQIQSLLERRGSDVPQSLEVSASIADEFEPPPAEEASEAPVKPLDRRKRSRAERRKGNGYWSFW